MRKIFFLILLAGMVAFAPQARAQEPAKQPAKQQPAKNPQMEGKFKKILTNAEFDALMATPEKMLIIDVRLPLQTVMAGGFPVYMHILAAGTDYIELFKQRIPQIPKEKMLIVMDNQGHRSLNLCNILDSMGYKVAGALGEEVYAANGGKVIKYDLPKPGEGTPAEK